MNRMEEIAQKLAKKFLTILKDRELESHVTNDGDLTIIITQRGSDDYTVTMISGSGDMFEKHYEQTVEEAVFRMFNQWAEEYTAESLEDLMERFDNGRINTIERYMR